jgi:L-alanine-DL-glutamate epimerase-like enolase superfamily enzyme
MVISNVEASRLNIPVKIPITEKTMMQGLVLVLVHTDDGVTGIGICRDRAEAPVCELISGQLGPFLTGRNPVETEGIWNNAWWELGANYKIRTGTVSRAISAVDQALWDIKGKYFGQPVFRLLGGASTSSIEAYTTFGLNLLDDEQLVELARQLVRQGHDKLKMQVVAANRGQDIRPDVTRVRLVREAVGEDVKIILDANSKYNFVNCLKLAKRIEPYDITHFDDPVYIKDVHLMAELRRQTTIPLAARAHGDNIWDNRDMIAGGAVDVVQPNVVDNGGYTECLKVAHMAEMYHLPLSTGGAFHLQNAHLIGGVSNGWMTEYHLLVAQASETIFANAPKAEGGRLQLLEKPGLGLELDEAAVREYTERNGG